MPARRPPLTAVAFALRDALIHPSWLLPALVLLLPTLVLQLAAPTYLRTRLAPAIWTVGVGSVLLIWLTQVATPAVTALVHARRTGATALQPASLARLSLAIGTSVTLGLALAVLPGLWVQARYAFAPLSAAGGTPVGAMRASAAETRPALFALMLLAISSLVASALGQGVVAVIAEWMGTITPVGDVNGRTVFALHYLSHAVTSVMAYLCSAAALSAYAVGVSATYDAACGVSRSPAPARARRVVGLPVRIAQVSAVAAVFAAVAAVIYKVQQHIY